MSRAAAIVVTPETVDLNNLTQALAGATIELDAAFWPRVEAAAAIVDESPKVDDPGLSPNDQSIKLDRKAEGNVYPIVLVSYAIACDQYEDPAVGERVKAYLGYIASAEGQQVAWIVTAAVASETDVVHVEAPALAAVLAGVVVAGEHLGAGLLKNIQYLMIFDLLQLNKQHTHTIKHLPHHHNQ